MINPKTATREELLAHLDKVADDWGMKRCSPAARAAITTPSLRIMVSRILRDAEQILGV